MYLYRNKNQTVVISTDDYPDSPRDYDDLFSFIGFSRRYRSPDNIEMSYLDFNDEILGNDDYVCYCVSIYEHGGVSFRLSRTVRDSFNDEWDSGIFGFMYASKKDILKFYGRKKFTESLEETAYNYAKSHLESYESYVNGECYCWESVVLNGDDLETIDSCSGYYKASDILVDLGLTYDNYVGEFETDDGIITYLRGIENES